MNAALRLVVVAFAAAASSGGVLCIEAAPQCGCHTPRWGNPSSFTFSVEFVNGVGSSNERGDFILAAQAAAGEWSRRLQAHGQNVTVSYVSSGGDVVVRVSADWDDDPYNHGNGYIDFDSDWFGLSGERLYADNAHEFGHSLGFDQATGNCSLMSDYDPNNPPFRTNIDPGTSSPAPLHAHLRDSALGSARAKSRLVRVARSRGSLALDPGTSWTPSALTCEIRHLVLRAPNLASFAWLARAARSL